jgi:hypothetical protein
MGMQEVNKSMTDVYSDGNEESLSNAPNVIHETPIRTTGVAN